MRVVAVVVGVALLLQCASCETPAEELARLVNEYRQANGRPAVPLSPALMEVARIHAEDLNNYPPSGSCNMHSWSNNGNGLWSGCCYTADHAQAQCMWDKPRQITASWGTNKYNGNGFENSFGGGVGYVATPAAALNGWKSSSGHNAVILNTGTWGNSPYNPWPAMGAGINGRYAVLWFGSVADTQVYVPGGGSGSGSTTGVGTTGVPPAPATTGAAPATTAVDGITTGIGLPVTETTTSAQNEIGNCATVRTNGRGCDNRCLDRCICSKDSFCCEQYWDDLCVWELRSFRCLSECNVLGSVEINQPVNYTRPDVEVNGSGPASIWVGLIIAAVSVVVATFM